MYSAILRSMKVEKRLLTGLDELEISEIEWNRSNAGMTERNLSLMQCKSISDSCVSGYEKRIGREFSKWKWNAFYSMK